MTAIQDAIQRLAQQAPRYDRHPAAPGPGVSSTSLRPYIVRNNVLKAPKTLHRKEVIETSSPEHFGALELRRYCLRGTITGLEMYHGVPQPTLAPSPVPVQEGSTTSIDSCGSRKESQEVFCRLVRLDRIPFTTVGGHEEMLVDYLLSDAPMGFGEGSSCSISPGGLSLSSENSNSSRPDDDSAAEEEDTPQLAHHLHQLANGGHQPQYQAPTVYCGVNLADTYDAMLQRVPHYAVDVAHTWNTLCGNFKLGHRTLIIDTAEELVHYFQGSPSTVHYAANYLDRILAVRPDFGSSNHQLRCLVVSCVLVAMKNLDVELPSTATISRACQDAGMAKNGLREVEISLLSNLKFRLQPVTLKDFVELFLCVAGASLDTRAARYALLLTDVILRDERLLLFAPHVVALGIIFRTAEVIPLSEAKSFHQEAVFSFARVHRTELSVVQQVLHQGYANNSQWPSRIPALVFNRHKNLILELRLNSVSPPLQ